MKTKHFFFCFSLAFVLLSNGWTENPIITFEKNYGGPFNDLGASVRQTSDGGFIITGNCSSSEAGVTDVYLIKTDAEGNITWEKSFGGPYNDHGNSVIQTLDGGYVIAGSTYPSEGSWDEAYVLKTDADGNLMWEKTFGGTNSDRFMSVDQTKDGGLIFTGHMHSIGGSFGPTCLLKTDAQGNTIWLQMLGDRTYCNEGISVQQTSDWGYIICGEYGISYEESDWDVWLVKTDSIGNFLWEKKFGGTDRETAGSAIETKDNGFIICGMTRSSGAGEGDFYLIKTDEFGNLVWEKTLGTPGNEFGTSIDETSDGGYVFTGCRNPVDVESGFGDLYIGKTDSMGNLLWEKTYTEASHDQGHSIHETLDQGLIVTGVTWSFGTDGQVYLIKTDAYGDVHNILKFGPGDSRWVQTEYPSPADFDGMTLFWGILKSENPDFEYNVYRPEGFTGEIEQPFYCDLDPFNNNYVIFEFKNISGEVELRDDVWVWDYDIPGGMNGLCGYPFYFAFYKLEPPFWGNREIIEYIPGKILMSELPHGDQLIHYPLSGYPGNIRSDFSEHPPKSVMIDIKPDDEQNSINLSSAGVISVAILSSESFDATAVNPDSIQLEGASVKIAGKSNKYLCHTEDVNADGLIDLLCQIDTNQLQIQPGQSVCVLKAKTNDGISIRGDDIIRIVKE